MACLLYGPNGCDHLAGSVQESPVAIGYTWSADVWLFGEATDQVPG